MPQQKKQQALPIRSRALRKMVAAQAQRGNVGFQPRFTATALDTVQDAVNAYLIALLESANHCADHADRITVGLEDLQLAHRLKGRMARRAP
jgi:histone H3/H4